LEKTMTDGVYIRILGPVAVEAGGVEVRPAGKAGTVLGILALQPGRTVAFGEFTETLWDGVGPKNTRNRIQAAIHSLRKCVEEACVGMPGPPDIETLGGGYRLRLNNAELDLLGMRGEIESARRYSRLAEHERAAEHYMRADDLWSGQALSSSASGSRVGHLADALEQERLDALTEWAHCAIAAADVAEVRIRLARWSELIPADESLQAALIQLHHVSGQTSRALRLYEKTRAYLAEELGIEPGEGLRALYQRILRET
jgi:DNA-binding SARP family transcriptional activator